MYRLKKSFDSLISLKKFNNEISCLEKAGTSFSLSSSSALSSQEQLHRYV